MPYIGTSLATNFVSTLRDEFTGDGSNTNFTLSRNAHHENDLEVFVGNVRQQPGDAYTVSGTTLAFTGTPANGEVIYVVHQAGALQTVQAPTDHGARDFNITGDANKITFGDDSEITMTHVADSGLALKNTNTGDDKPFTLVLQTGETDIAANDKLGVINFQAPDEGTGTDAILVAAGIEAVSEGDFSSSSNATKLSFKTASSAAAAETMSLSSGGNLTVSGNVSVGGDLDVTGSFDMSDANITNVGSIALDSISGDADSNTSITFSGSDVITFATGGSTAFTANADQTVTFSGSITGTSATLNSGITIDNITIDGTEIDLSSGDLTIDVAGDIILDVAGEEVIFKDGSTNVGHISMDSDNLTIKSLVSDKDMIFQGNDGGSGITALTLDMSASGAATFNSSVTLGGGLIIPDGGDIGSASDLNAIGISSGGVISITATTANTNASDGALTVAGGVGIAADLSVGDDLRLISDSAVLSFGADSEITITHVADTGLNIKHTATGDDKPIILTLQTGETDMAANDVIGAIRFQAPDEGTGTDAILVAAAIQAVSEGDFSSSSNATRLEFHTGASEAAASKMTLSSAGVLDVDGGITIDNITIDGTEIDLSSGDLTIDVAGDIILDADGADVKLSDGGTNFLTFTKSSNDVSINTPISDGDISFIGNDGGSAITAMKMDMSAGGAVTIDPNNVLSTASGANAKLNVGSLSGTAGALNVNVVGTDGGGAYRLCNFTDGTQTNFIIKSDNTGSDNFLYAGPETTSDYILGTAGTERVRIKSGGNTLVGTTNQSPAEGSGTGTRLGSNGRNQMSADGDTTLAVNRVQDGRVMAFHSAGTLEGEIGISGNTTTYGAFTGTHWSRLTDNSKPTILKGTVLESIDEMCDWYSAKFTVAATTRYDDIKDEFVEDLPEYVHYDPIALPDGGKVGDTITHTYNDITYNDAVIVKEKDMKHPKCKISDTADSKSVYGVFCAWDADDDTVNDMKVASLGTYVIRIHKDETVSKGDLLVSNGDGTAKVQDDDIIRTKSIGKVIANVKQETYDDGSYTVPCALYCG